MPVARYTLLACALPLLGASPPHVSHDAPGAPPAGARTVVVGIDQAFPPYQYVDERGEPAGFDVDLVRALAERAPVEVVFRAGPWYEIFAALRSGEVDVAASVVRTAEREAGLDFSVPTSVANHVAFGRGAGRVESTADLAGRSVAVERDSFWHERLEGIDPDVVLLPVPAPIDSLRLVAEGTADVAILLESQGIYLARELGIEGVRTLGPPLSTRHFRFALVAGRDAQLTALNDGILRLREEGVYDALYDRWFGVLRPEPMIDRQLAVVLAWIAVMLLGGLLSSHLWSRSLERRVGQRTAELHTREAENRTLQRQLLVAQKMEALGRFAGGIAHDFNNLLTTVIGNASLVGKDLPEGSRAARGLGSIEKAAEAGARLTRQLLAFGRREPGEPRSLDWAELLRDSEEMLARLVGSTVQIKLDADPDVSPVWIDPTQALQVVMNLIANARDAISGPGNIRLEVAGAPGPRVRMTVRDDGAGMDAETRQRIFEPFFSTKGDDGTGLGLATVYGIVKRYGGEIEVESEPGRGAAFHVLLPPAGAKEQPKPLEPAVSGAAPPLVLLVEPDAAVRSTGEALLLALGHPVDVVSSGEEALVRARERGECAVVITDAELPGFPGLALASALLEQRPTLRILLTSEADEIGSLETDARVGHLTKPYTQETLAAALASVLGT